MKIATWNINGVKARIDNLTHWLSESAPDIVCLQEIKSVDEQFPRADRGARLQCRDARPEGLQRRRPPVQAPLRRGQPRPAGRRCRRAGALHRGGLLDARRGAARRLALYAERQSDRHRQVRLQARLDGAAGGLGRRPPGPGGAAGARRRLQRHPGADRRQEPRGLGHRRAVPAGEPAGVPPAGPSRLHRRGPRRQRRRWHLHLLGLPGRRLAEEQRHPHRSPDAVAGGRRPAALACVDRHVRAWEKPSDHVPTAVVLSL